MSIRNPSQADQLASQTDNALKNELGLDGSSSASTADSGDSRLKDGVNKAGQHALGELQEKLGIGTLVVESKVKPHIDKEEGRFAHDFLRALGGDRDSPGLESVLKAHAVKDENSKIHWEKTAEKLVESMHGLVPDEKRLNKDGEWEITKNKLKDDDAAKLALKLNELMSGEEQAHFSAAKMAQTLGDAVIKTKEKDPNDPKKEIEKKESLFAYMTKIGVDNGYEVSFTTDQLIAFADFLNRMTNSDLGNVLLEFVRVRGMDDDEKKAYFANRNNDFVEERPHVGETGTLAEFLRATVYAGGSTNMYVRARGLPEFDENNQPIKYNQNIDLPKFNKDTGQLGLEKDQRDFFTGDYSKGKPFNLGHGAGSVERNFQAMVVEPLIKGGRLVISDNYDEAQIKKEVTNVTYNTLYGAQLNGELIDQMVKNGDLVAKNTEDEKPLPEFVAELKQALKEAEIHGAHSDIDDMSQKLVELVHANKDISFKDDPQAKRPDPKEYVGIKGHLQDNYLVYYAKAGSPEDVADVVARYGSESGKYSMTTNAYYERANVIAERPIVPNAARVQGETPNNAAPVQPASGAIPRDTSPAGEGGAESDVAATEAEGNYASAADERDAIENTTDETKPKIISNVSIVNSDDGPHMAQSGMPITHYFANIVDHSLSLNTPVLSANALGASNEDGYGIGDSSSGGAGGLKIS